MASNSRHAVWETRIVNEQNPVKKAALIRSFKIVQEQERLGLTRFDPSLVQGGRPHCIPEIVFYVHKSVSKDIDSKGKKFSTTNYECTRLGLPFVEVTPDDGTISVANDLSAVMFKLTHASDWTGGRTAIVSATGKVAIRMMKCAEVMPGWYKFGSFTVEQKKGGKDGTVFTNLSCQSVEPWDKAPAFYMLHRLCCRLWTNDRYMPRPIDPTFYPPTALVSEMEQELRYEKSTSAASSSKEDAPDDESSSIDYELFARSFNKAFERHLQSMGIDWQLHDDLRQQAPNSRHPYIIPLTLGDSAREMITGAEENIMTDHQEVHFSGDIRVKKGGNEVKVFEPSGKNPFSMHVSAAAMTSVMRVNLSEGAVNTLTLAISMRGTSFFHYLGVVNPYIAQGVLPRVLPHIPMTVLGSPNAQTTREKDSTGTENAHTLIVDVFNPPIVDYLEMIRKNSVQVTAAHAVHEINRYIKMYSASARINDVKAKAAVLLEGESAKMHKHIFESNAVAMLSGNLVLNCMENKITVNAKKGSATHRFYAMTGLVPNEEQLAAYRATAKAFHAAQPNSAEAQALHAELEQHAEKHSIELKKHAGASDYFLPNDELNAYGIAPTVIIWAISRELDHIVDPDYTNEAFSLKAVRERSAYITSLNAKKMSKVPPPSPMPIEDTPSLDLDAVTAPAPVSSEASSSVADNQTTTIPVIDDEEEEHVVVDDRPKGRKRREAPTSPGKKNAVAKKERIR